MDSSENLIQLIEQPLQSNLSTPMLYLVKSGDSLSKIITKHYDISYHSPQYKVAEASVLYFNESIVNPNAIQAGQLLRLMPLPEDNAMAYCEVPDDFNKEHRALPSTRHRLEPAGPDYIKRVKHHLPTTPEEQDAFWALSWLHENYGILSTASGAGFTAFGGLVAQSNNAFIAEIQTHYNQYQQGKVSQNQYNYRRRKALRRYAKQVGPFEKLLFKGKTTNEAIRINRSKSLPATANIDKHLNRLGSMAKYAKHGGTVLTVAGVGMGCYNIAQADTRQQKNEIFVETLGSTLASAATTYALAIYFIATPTGWITALALGAGAAAVSMGAGKGSASIYNRFFQKHDLVNMSGVDSLCK